MIKALACSVMDSRRAVNFHETEKSLSMKNNNELCSCSSQTITSVGQTPDKLLKRIPFVYLEVTFNIENAA